MEYNLTNLERIMREERKNLRLIKKILKEIINKNNIKNFELNLETFKIIKEKCFMINDREVNFEGYKLSVYNSIKELVERKQAIYSHSNNFIAIKENGMILIIEMVNGVHYAYLYCNVLTIDYISDILTIKLEHKSEKTLLDDYLIRYGYLIKKDSEKEATYMIIKNNDNKQIKEKDIMEVFNNIKYFKEKNKKEIEVIITVNNKRFAYYCEL